MLPSRGSRPAQFAHVALRQPRYIQSSASRKFSSLPRTAGLSAPSCRNSPLQSAGWRTGATRAPNVVLTASSIRNGSWYAPWSWGKSTPPSDGTVTTPGDQVPIAEFSKSPPEPVVTSSTPELAPAGIDKAAVVNDPASSNSGFVETLDSKTIDELLALDPAKDVLPAAVDPTTVITHAGQMQELGLDYGYGMTTMIEKTMEQLYLQTGWGWAATIGLTAVGVRLLTFLPQALSSNQMAGLAALRPITEPLQKKMEEAIARGDKQQEQIYRLKQAEIMKPHMGGIFSLGGFMFVQAWVGYSAFRLLRAMAALPIPGMEQDGLWWFSNLSIPDPYYVLPATTTAIFYALFKSGGETGVQTMGGPRQKIMTGMAFMLGFVTAFQAAGLQLYFLASGILGAGTGALLKNNTFRRMINIRPLPSKESDALYSKVIKGEVKLADIKSADGKVRYQAPRPAATPNTRRTTTTLAGIKVKEGSNIPLHLRPEGGKAKNSVATANRDVDFEQGAQGTMLQKMDYYRRNYRLSMVARRMAEASQAAIRRAGWGGKKLSDQQQKRKDRAEQYEIERRRRFENRK